MVINDTIETFEIMGAFFTHIFYNVLYLESKKLKVNFYKIASVDTINIPLIKKIGNTGKPLILSTGMSNLSIIEDAVKAFKETGNKNLILLHCLSSYPANENEVNLKAINTLKKKNLHGTELGEIQLHKEIEILCYIKILEQME